MTADGKPIAPAKGRILAGKPVTYPTQTVAASTFLPNLSEYDGPPLEFGRMEPTVSDPGVQQQWGMRVGIPNAGQLNALETLNIRGERSVTCKGKLDAPASSGPLPKDAPPACEEFRKQPDALEYAAQLDKQYGRHPDLKKMPMYCVVFAWKNWYDAKDIRATGGNDVKFAMDAPRLDSPDVADLRAKGAISFAIANAAHAGASEPGAGESEIRAPWQYTCLCGVGRTALQSLRYGAGPARIQFRLRCRRFCEPRRLLALRADRRLVQGPRFA